jgi:hypothetical protein
LRKRWTRSGSATTANTANSMYEQSLRPHQHKKCVITLSSHTSSPPMALASAPSRAMLRHPCIQARAPTSAVASIRLVCHCIFKKHRQVSQCASTAQASSLLPQHQESVKAEDPICHAHVNPFTLPQPVKGTCQSALLPPVLRMLQHQHGCSI